MINSNAAMIRSPRIGQSVFIPFITGDVSTVPNQEKIGYIKGGAAMPFDTIEQVYAETEYTNHGKKVFNVRVKSGDAVKVIEKDDKWQAIA